MPDDWWRNGNRTERESADGAGGRGDDDPIPGSSARRAGTTRRRFVSALALAGGLSGVGRTVGQSDDEESADFELEGVTSGWVGRRPEDIEGETNPTLTLTPDEAYQVAWVNADGAPHNFALEDADGEVVAASEIISEEGATQVVEFTATEELAEYLCEVHPTSMRGDIEIDGDDEDDETDQRGFDQAVVEQERGDVARFEFSMGDAERAEMVLGSRSVNYQVSFTAVDGDDDEEVTVALDTFMAGRGSEPAVSTIADDDEIRDFSRLTSTLSSPLDVAVYPIQASIDGDPIDSSVLVLHPRETRAAHAGVAPEATIPGETDAFFGRVSRRDEVATGDWAVTEFGASGLYATLKGRDAFTDESLGYELSIEKVEVFNAEPDSVPLQDVQIVVDESENRFFAAVDSAVLETDETYEATFAITDANPYLETDEREELSAEFSVVDRDATFDVEGDVLSVPPAEATLSGRTTVAPGTVLLVMAFDGDDGSFQKTGHTVVSEDGTWSASLDFSDLEPGTTFSAEVVGLSSVVEGQVTQPE